MSLKDLRKKIDGLPVKLHSQAHESRNKINIVAFDEYWDNYGELHAAGCGGNIKLFAKEIWESAIDAQPDPLAEARKKIEEEINNAECVDGMFGGGALFALQWVLDEVLKEGKG